jgi:hypothetical protein
LSPNTIEKILLFLIISTFFITLSSLLKPFTSVHPLFDTGYWYLTWNQQKGLSLKYFYFFIIIMLIFYLFRLKLNKDIIYAQSVMPYYVVLLFGLFFTLIFREEEMFADRIFYYFFSFIPILIFGLRKFFVEKNIVNIFIYIGINMWFVKSYLIQYVGWYITQSLIRK